MNTFVAEKFPGYNFTFILRLKLISFFIQLFFNSFTISEKKPTKIEKILSHSFWQDIKLDRHTR